ncbi:MAG: LL-diaminopimelate aminotransferase [Actinobacteria bacterium]|nr:LL-diaminopimelate aminotransferase [Actinomycetota bacterium]
MKFEEAERLKKLPPYLFAEIDAIIRKKKKEGLDVISLGIGDPDIPTPPEIIKTLCRQARNPVNHRYPSSYGLEEFRRAVAGFYNERFNVELDPETEIIALWGSKEGVSNIAYTFVNPGDYVLVPDPAYPVYSIGTAFAGGIPFKVPLKEENGFLVDFDSIDPEIAVKSKLMHVNYPNNPTSATCDAKFFKDLVDFATRYDILICHDNAYGDTYYGDIKPVSFLNIPGARETGVEFYSFSKTFNMTGWRIGCAVGNRHAIASLGKYKTNVDSGVFNAIQYAAAIALKHYSSFSSKNNHIYKQRREKVTGLLNNMGIGYYKSDATIYIWAKVPEGYDSVSFSKMVLDRANVVITPGSAYGSYGEGYFRISLTINDSRLEEALRRIGEAL